ncbi:flagellar hook-associated protein 3 [Duganella sp. FT50W]|uniref:Flagellar hook-associated protein 3 n=1 Tax=Duganella lactea TaxID=2692173 RepID=A0A6L8MSW9_9BURK|nr:flagellar hook-associated protein FlgL [Duganella lactea]MYM35278.1 flagellar hook-associated protein 3 [Duganella lactea]MYM85143.1 flagellar hook-associated protein 3 [Duganella lactea]
MIMRISTKTMFDIGSTQITSLSSSMARTQQQLATGRKNLTAADDPIASARALEVTQSQSLNTQLATNRSNAKALLSSETTALASATSLMHDIKTLAVQAGNGSYTASDLASLASELEGSLADLLGVANTSDGVGGYVFSGYKSTTLPFTKTPTGAEYQGDQGQRALQVGSTRTLPITDSGTAVFEANATGNGTFVTTPDTGNYGRGGTGIISAGSVKDPTLLTGNKYQINFQVVPAQPGIPKQTTYTVTNLTTGTPVPADPDPAEPQPYVSGQNISFDGLQFDIKGDPADGDSFGVAPSTKQSIFSTVQGFIDALRSPGAGAPGNAQINNMLNQLQVNIDNATDNVLSVQSAVGARLKELDYLDSSGDDLGLQYSSTLSTLQDLDYTAAISLFTQQQTTLTAAQKSFTTMSGLSLFNYIS